LRPGHFVLPALTGAASLRSLNSKLENSTVFTLADLEAWKEPGTSLAVLGHPIKHSISPAMHNAALGELARTDPRFADWRYHRFEIHPDDLPRALTLLHAKKFRGINLTVPHKIIAFERVAAVDPAARPVGAVNTLLWTPAGWHGFNTDGYGMATAIRESLGRDLSGAPILLLGAGGAARGAGVECLQRGCPELWIANRTRETLDELLAVLAPLRGSTPLHGLALGRLGNESGRLPPGLLVINATSAGLRETDPLPIDLGLLSRPVAVYDMIYNPPQTRLLRAAAGLGLPHAHGLGMLIHQGARALEIWSGIPAARTAPAMSSAAHAALGLSEA
jgi:shikimate dehydrogenase